MTELKSKMTELKPCPFCGSEKIQFLIDGYFQPWEGEGMCLWYSCSCYECGGKIDTGDTQTMKAAAQEWNKRAGKQK